jgi:hypothetical protein
MTWISWPTWKRKIRRTAVVLLVVTGLLAGTHYYLRWTAEWDLRRALAEADQLDPGWRYRDLEAKREAVDDAENSALKVLTVHKSMAPAWPIPQQVYFGPGRLVFESTLEMDLEGEIARLAPEVQLSPRQIQVLNGIMKYSARVLGNARALAQFPRGRYSIEYPRNPQDLAPGSSQANHVAQLLWADAVLAAQQKKMDQAVTSSMAMLNTARSIGDEPIGKSQQQRLTMDNLAVRTLERVLAQGQATDDELKRMQRLIQEEASEPLFLNSLRGERASAAAYINAIQSGRMRYRLQFYHGKLARQLPGSWQHYLDMVIVRRAQPDYFRLLTALVEIAKLAPEDWEAQIEQLKPRAEPLPVEFKSWFQSAAGSFGPFQINLALLRCSQSALAAERFRLAHGRWPDSLSAMIPEFLPDVPTDPFDRQPLRFRRCHQGIMIYSVGPDGHDDGGILNRQHFASGSDVGFQLWDVAARRQPWRPPPESVSGDKVEEASEVTDR